jgi:2-iminoacetate synthase
LILWDFLASTVNLAHPSSLLRRFIGLLALIDHHRMQLLAKRSTLVLTRHHFGKTMRMFARENAILRVTLEIDEVAKEARHLAAQGFRNLLLVAGEHPKFVSHKYLERCMHLIAAEVPSISLEVAPWKFLNTRK